MFRIIVLAGITSFLISGLYVQCQNTIELFYQDTFLIQLCFSRLLSYSLLIRQKDSNSLGVCLTFCFQLAFRRAV